MESINPVDNQVGIRWNNMKGQDGQPKRREDSKHRVEVSGLEPPTSTLRT